MNTLATNQKGDMSNGKRFEFWLDDDTKEIIDGLEHGKKKTFINEAIRFYAENQDRIFDNERAAIVMADRIAVKLLKKLDIS